MPGKSGVRPAGALPSAARNGSSSSTSASARSAASSHTVVAGVGGHGQVLQPAHRRDEPAETRAGAGRAVFRESRRGGGIRGRVLLDPGQRPSRAGRQDVAAHDGLIPSRTDADARNMCSGKLFQPQHVVARLGGQVVELPRAPRCPPTSRAAPRRSAGAVQFALRHRHLGGALPVDLDSRRRSAPFPGWTARRAWSGSSR